MYLYIRFLVLRYYKYHSYFSKSKNTFFLLSSLQSGFNFERMSLSRNVLGLRNNRNNRITESTRGGFGGMALSVGDFSIIR